MGPYSVFSYLVKISAWGTKEPRVGAQDWYSGEGVSFFRESVVVVGGGARTSNSRGPKVCWNIYDCYNRSVHCEGEGKRKMVF